jgi:hypothetical protein
MICRIVYSWSPPQASPIAKLSTTRGRANCRNPTSLIQIDRFAYRRIAQPRKFNNAHHAMAFAMQTNNLLSPLVQLLQCLISCAFFAYAAANQKTQKYSNIIGPDQ